MLTFNLNSLNDISMDAMIKLQDHVENSFDMKFNINEKDSEGITYSFAELSAITAKLEELTAGVSTEMEEKINKIILENDEPNSEIIQDIKELRRIVLEQKQKRKEVKQMIKRYKRNIKAMKYILKQQKEKRNNSIDELEI